MIIELNRKTPFKSAVINGVIYLRIPIPYTVHRFTPLDIYSEITVKIQRHSEEDGVFGGDFVAEVVQIEDCNDGQYIVVREKHKKSLQHFED